MQVFLFVCLGKVFPSRCLIAPTPFVEKIIFHQSNCFVIIIKHQLAQLVWIYFEVLCSVSVISVAIPPPIPYNFDYYSFAIVSEIRKCESFFFKISSAIQNFLWFQTNVITFPIPVKCFRHPDRDYTELTDYLGQYEHFSNINSSNQ